MQVCRGPRTTLRNVWIFHHVCPGGMELRLSDLAEIASPFIVIFFFKLDQAASPWEGAAPS